MRNATQSALVLLTMLAGFALAQPAGVEPLRDNRRSTSMIGVTPAGELVLTARETPVNLRFRTGKTGMGNLFVLFDSSTGLYDRQFYWQSKERPPVFGKDGTFPGWLVGVTPEQMILVAIVSRDVMVINSSEKAADLADAESKSLRWISEHLDEVESRSAPPAGKSTGLPLNALSFPPGILVQEDWMSSAQLPLKLLAITPGEKYWSATFENTNSHQRAIVPLALRPEAAR